MSRGDGLRRALRAVPTRSGQPPCRHSWAAAALAAVVLAYLWPVLVGGKILSPLAILSFRPPWLNHAPLGAERYANHVLSDIPLAFYPWQHLTRELIRSATFPAWDPHVLTGAPLYANPQIALLSPFSLPLWLLPLDYGIGLSAALKLWFGGFGAYLLARRLGLGLLPGLLAGVSFAFCSFDIVWLTHHTLPAVAVVLPWMLWATERILERARLGAVLVLAVVTACAIAGGHPGTQTHVAAATGLYAIVRVASLPGLQAARRLRLLALAGGGLALGTLLMAVVLVPELLLSHGAVGTLARRGGRGLLPGEEMPLSAIRTVLFPNWWGRPPGLEAHSRPANYNEATFYAGVAATLLACVGLAAGGSWRRKAPFALFAVLGLAIPLRAPVLYGLVERLPGLELVQNQRLHLLFELGTAMLAAFGLQALLDRPAGDRRRAAVVLAAAIPAAVAFVTAGPGADPAGVPERVLGTPSRSEAALALTSVGWYAVFAGAVAAGLVAARLRPRRVTVVAAALVLVAAADMLHFAHGYQPMGPAAVIVPSRPATVRYLERHARQGRFVGIESALPNDWGVVYGLDDVRGYDPPLPTLRYFKLWQAINPEQTFWRPLSVDTLTPASLRLLSVLGARYVVVGPEAMLEGSASAMHALVPVHRDRDATIYLNPVAIPRALIPRRLRLASGEEATVAALAERRFDPRRTAVVERDQPGADALPATPPSHAQVALAQQRDARVTLRASLDRPGLVVLDDELTAGWTVQVDGRPAHALRVDGVMRGVVVGAGRHRIVWSYRVPGLLLGAVLSACALALLLAGATLVALRSLRAR
jgi:hypothetical protein